MSGGEDFGKPCSAILPEVLRHGDSGLPFWEEDEEEQEEQGGGAGFTTSRCRAPWKEHAKEQPSKTVQTESFT